MEAGLVYGGRFASTVITKLINGIIDYAKDQKNMQLGLKDELKRVEKALPKIQVVVNAVDEGLIKEANPPLEKWLWKLRDAADQADDVMDEMEYNFVKEKVLPGRNKVSKAMSNFRNFVECAIPKDGSFKNMKEAVKAIDEVASDVGEFYMLVEGLVKNHKDMGRSAINSRETSSVLNVGTHVFGREKEKECIIEKLLNPEYKVEGIDFAVLPVVGVGGVGKTTLAQHVYNDPVVKKHFELRMWVCVSNNFDVALLTKKLYESAFGQRADFDNFDSIQTRLENKLKSTSFLIVFDDVWNDNDKLGWDKLFAPLKSGKSGSMILLTTRMKTVASHTGPNLMNPVLLNGLNESELWKIFKQCAFRGEDPSNHRELVEIGRGIVKKLKGSPLAAKTVGGILCSKLSREHWESVLESELWSLKQGGHDIMPALSLTYQHLPSHLKPCFTFCSIFPRDHVFIKDDLIYMWLALGLVPRDSNGSKRPEDVGSEYFEEMLSRSIFIQANPISNAHLHYPAYTYCSSTAEKQLVGGYVLHDLMHDLSAFVSQGECLTSETNMLADIPTTVRHLYIRIDDCTKLRNLKLKNIRTLILQFDDSNPLELVCILNEMLKGMTSLRLLTLLSLKLSEIPESVSGLLHLRYLSLSSFMLGEFPPSMSRLHHLETMVCGGFGFINQANVLGKLISLRHIIASESFVDAIAGKGKLISLQELTFRVDKESGFEISELSNMRELQRLTISNINDVGNLGQAKQANLRNKVGLRELSLQWETTEFDEQVFDHLVPNSNLKDLRIRNYMGGRLPVWKSGSFSSLVKLEISDCHNIMSLAEGILEKPHRFAALQKLAILECSQLTYLPEGGFSKFISLKELHIRNCCMIQGQSVQECFLPSELQVLRIESCGDLDATLQKALETVHSLISLELSCCNNITSLPPKEVLSRWKTLEKLEIKYCHKLTSLEGLLGLSSVKLLIFCGCPKLVSENEEIVEAGTIQNSSGANSTELTPKDLTEKPQLSVDELEIDDALLLSIEPVRSISAVRKLTIHDCLTLHSLPELPPALEELSLYDCCLELQRRCEDSGEDWPKISLIPKVDISPKYSLELKILLEELMQQRQQHQQLESSSTSRQLDSGGSGSS